MVSIDKAVVGVGDSAAGCGPSWFPSEGSIFEPCMIGRWIIGDTREEINGLCKNSESSIREMEKEAARLYAGGTL